MSNLLLNPLFLVYLMPFNLARPIVPRSVLLNRLDALLLVLKSCTGRLCTNPWETLHPIGDVH